MDSKNWHYVKKEKKNIFISTAEIDNILTDPEKELYQDFIRELKRLTGKEFQLTGKESLKMFIRLVLVNLFYKATISFHKDDKGH